MSIEAHYRQVLELSQRMLAEGMAQHWDEMAALEAERQRLFDATPVLGPADSRERLRELIGQIQRCDAQLNEKLEAWMHDARILLRIDARSSPQSE